MVLSRFVALLILGLMLALRIADPGPLAELRRATFDWYETTTRPRVQYLPTQIVEIDSPSLEAYGQWPWQRSRLAVLIGRIRQQGAAAIGLDLRLAEPDPSSAPRLADSIYGLSEAGRAALRRLPDSDVMLADAIRQGAVVVGREAGEASPSGKPAPIKAKVSFDGPKGLLQLLPRLDVGPALPLLEQAADGVGVLAITPDPDGEVRRLPLAVRDDGQIIPSLEAEMVRLATGAGTLVFTGERHQILAARIGHTVVPTDPEGYVWFRARRHDPTRFISAKALLDNTLPPDTLAGRLVLVGVSAPGVRERYATPLGPLSGVEIHAQALDSMLSGFTLARPVNALGLELALAILAGLAIIVILPLVPPGGSLPLLLAVIANLGVLSYAAFLTKGLLIDPSHAILTALAIYLYMEWELHRRLGAQIPREY